jgi:hypothetical protein
MATVTLSSANLNQPEAVEKGVNVQINRISLSVSWSSGDVHRIGKLPHGAIPLDAIFFPGTAHGAGFVAKFGTSASQELFFASATYSVSSRTIRALGTAKQVSLSDDAMPRFEYVTMVATAVISAGYVGDLITYYKMPGQTP